MPRKLRTPSRRALAITAATVSAVAFACGVAGLLVSITSIGDRNDIEWGTAPAWLSAAFSGLTLAGVWVAYINLRTTREQRRDDQASPARLLVIEKTALHIANGPKDNYASVIVTLRNASTNSAFTSIAVNGVTLNGIGCQQTLDDDRRERIADNFRFLAPNDTVQSGWIMPFPNTKIFPGRTEVQYEYTDSNGRRWRRLGRMEPQRVHSAEFDIERLRRFEAALQARPTYGARQVPVSVDIAVKSAFPRVGHQEPESAEATPPTVRSTMSLLLRTVSPKMFTKNRQL